MGGQLRTFLLCLMNVQSQLPVCQILGKFLCLVNRQRWPRRLLTPLYCCAPCSQDHAVVMAKFARDCISRMRSVVNKLEVELGPDTGTENIHHFHIYAFLLTH